MTDLQIFENSEFGTIRTAQFDGKTYFVANDVAKALGYVETAKAVRTHCKGCLSYNWDKLEETQ